MKIFVFALITPLKVSHNVPRPIPICSIQVLAAKPIQAAGIDASNPGQAVELVVEQQAYNMIVFVLPEIERIDYQIDYPYLARIVAGFYQGVMSPHGVIITVKADFFAVWLPVIIFHRPL